MTVIQSYSQSHVMEGAQQDRPVAKAYFSRSKVIQLVAVSQMSALLVGAIWGGGLMLAKSEIYKDNTGIAVVLGLSVSIYLFVVAGILFFVYSKPVRKVQ